MHRHKESLKDRSLELLTHLPGIHSLHSRALELEDRPGECAEWFQSGAKRLVMPALDRVGAHIEGIHNFPTSGPVILAPSHVDQTDPFTAAHVALSVRPDLIFRILAKHQLDRPLLRALLNGSVVYINRVRDTNHSDEDRRNYNADKMMQLAEAVAAVEDGRGAGMIFPWGTRESEGSLPIRIGVLLLAGHVARLRGEEVPIVLMGMQGNTLGRYVTRLLVPGNNCNVAITIPEPVVIRPNFLELLEREGEHGEHVQPIRDLLRIALHSATHQSLQIIGDMCDFGYLDEPSDVKKRGRVSSHTTE